MPLDEVDRRIINTIQGGFPLSARPFQEMAVQIGISERRLITRIKHLLRDRVLTRFGPLFNADRMGGVNILAAMSVAKADWEDVTNIVNAQPEIAHNYRREHAINMWFVGAGESLEQVEAAFLRIEAATGLEVLRFPKEREFFVELKLNV
jgi:DNA-binding Lrp family transcriptional regulator